MTSLEAWYLSEVKKITNEHAARVADIEAKLQKLQASLPRALNGEVIELSPAVMNEKCASCGRFFSEMVCSRRLVKLATGRFYHRECFCALLTTRSNARELLK